MDFILNLLEFNTTIQYSIIFTLLGLYFLLLWGSFVIYVWKNSKLYYGFDANFLRGGFILGTALFGFGGLLIYFMFRGDSIEQERLFKIEDGLLQREAWLCPECLEIVVRGEHFCINCGFATKKKCQSCESFNRPDNKYCQSCGVRFPHIQVDETSISIHNHARTLTIKKRLNEFLQKFRLEIRNSRNFKMEPSIASFLKDIRTKNNKKQKSAKK